MRARDRTGEKGNATASTLVAGGKEDELQRDKVSNSRSQHEEDKRGKRGAGKREEKQGEKRVRKYIPVRFVRHAVSIREGCERSLRGAGRGGTRGHRSSGSNGHSEGATTTACAIVVIVIIVKVRKGAVRSIRRSRAERSLQQKKKQRK